MSEDKFSRKCEFDPRSASRHTRTGLIALRPRCAMMYTIGHIRGSLAKGTGRSRSFLAAEAIGEFVDVNEWQIAGIKRAMQSLDRGEGIAHEQVKEWVRSWGGGKERPAPKRSTA